MTTTAPAAGTVTAATTEVLEAAGRLNTALGQGALILARRLDDPGADTGSAIAALAREHRAQLAAALQNAEVEEDVLQVLVMRAGRRRLGLAEAHLAAPITDED